MQPKKTLSKKEKVLSGQYSTTDDKEYWVLNVSGSELPDVPQGRYLIDDAGKFVYLVDPGVNGKRDKTDDGVEARNKFDSPKTQMLTEPAASLLRERLHKLDSIWKCPTSTVIGLSVVSGRSGESSRAPTLAQANKFSRVNQHFMTGSYLAPRHRHKRKT